MFLLILYLSQMTYVKSHGSLLTVRFRTCLFYYTLWKSGITSSEHIHVARTSLKSLTHFFIVMQSPCYGYGECAYMHNVHEPAPLQHYGNTLVWACVMSWLLWHIGKLFSFRQQVYVRRAYIAYDLNCLQHAMLSSGLCFVEFQFMLPSSHPNR